jgi:hypothetical protein
VQRKCWKRLKNIIRKKSRQKCKEPNEILQYLHTVGMVDSKIKVKVAGLVRTEIISNP